MPQGLSIRAYAKHRGVRHSAVQKAIKARRVPVLSDGSIDPAAADLAWAHNTDQVKLLNSAGGRAKHHAGAPPEPPSAGAPILSDLTRAQTARAAIAAKREELKLRLDQKNVVSAEEVRLGLFTVGRRGRDRLIAWGVRVKQAHLGALDVAEFNALVDEAIADTIAEMSTPFAVTPPEDP